MNTLYSTNESVEPAINSYLACFTKEEGVE